MWTVKEQHNGQTKAQIIATLKEKLLALKPLISEIKYFEVGVNCLFAGKNFDVVLLSEFESEQALQAYASHPEHLKVVDFVKEIATGRAAVDFEV
jgi:hypothetical protein